MTTRGRLTLIALLALSCWTATAAAQTWSRRAPFPEAAEEVYGIAAGGRFYVFGGLAPGWKPKGLVYEYDPARDAWTRKSRWVTLPCMWRRGCGGHSVSRYTRARCSPLLVSLSGRS